MDKREFLRSIDYTDKDILSNIYEKYSIYAKTGREVIVNDFLPPPIWHRLLSMSDKLDAVISTSGFFEDAERRMLSFSYEEIKEFPYKILCIKNKSKFRHLQHKDFLGSLMALGIKREKIGDLILKDEVCYTVVCSELAEYIKDNLINIANCPCSITEIDSENESNIQAEYVIINILCTSLRLDCIVGAICNISRNKAVDMIDQGRVLANYEVITDKSRNIEISSVLTIRGFGKFKLLESNGLSQRGREKIQLKKYI